MSTKEKLLRRLLAMPNDLTFSEAAVLLGHFGFIQGNKGKTSGSRVIFVNGNGVFIILHRPHPGNCLNRYQIKQIISVLRSEGLI